MARRSALFAVLVANACFTGGASSVLPESDGPRTPQQAVALRRQGARLVDRVLEGELDLVRQAEGTLERAYRLDPEDRTTARLLGRFLNLRLSEGDLSKAGLQASIYRDLTTTAQAPRDAFVFECFAQAASSAYALSHGRRGRALVSVHRLERSLAAHLREAPMDIEATAMAGNYAMELAVRVPTGRRRRIRQAVRRLERQQEHWDEQSVLAKGLGVAPGTRAVFAFWLAEMEAYLERPMQARRAYARVVAECEAPDASSARCELATLARARVQGLDDHLGRAGLVPVWPRGAAACVACHSQDARIPPRSVRPLLRDATDGRAE